MENEITQTELDFRAAEALAKRWARAYGLRLRYMPTLKMLDAVNDYGWALVCVQGSAPEVYGSFVKSLVELTGAGNAEGLEIQVDLRERDIAQ